MKGRRVIKEKGKDRWVNTFSLRFNGRELVVNCKFTNDPGKSTSFPEEHHHLARALVWALSDSMPLSTWHLTKPPALEPQP